LTNQLTGL